MKIKIEREYKDNETLGTAQVIDDNGNSIFDFKTIELPYLDNAPTTSCIPVGTYPVIKSVGWGNIPYEHFAVENVPHRAGICIHIGNYAEGKRVDSEGCILVGNAFADINGDGHLDVVASGITLGKLLSILPGKFELEII
jgi:hypothetical protein